MNEWDQAIADAESEIATAEAEIASLKKRVGRLRFAAKVFRENKSSGAPWPSGPNEPAVDPNGQPRTL